MTEINLVSQPTVQLVDWMGEDDTAIVQAAQVSVVGGNEGDGAKDPVRFINYLMKWRHGSPFESIVLKFYVKAPIFVVREFMRHRMASYNEVSGRYKKLEPDFYVYPTGRPVVNEGSGAVPKLVAGDMYQELLVHDSLQEIYEQAWSSYETLIDAGIANEVARAVLPVGIMSEFYVTMNLRGLMNFLSLRTSDSGLSNPQREIEDVAKAMEVYFAERYPAAYAAFNNNGRIAP